jgi:hypothetical protein
MPSDRFIFHNGQRLRINERAAVMYPRNCPVVEKTADGRVAGTCAFNTPRGICPRHGEWAKNAEVIHRAD